MHNSSLSLSNSSRSLISSSLTLSLSPPLSHRQVPKQPPLGKGLAGGRTAGGQQSMRPCRWQVPGLVATWWLRPGGPGSPPSSLALTTQAALWPPLHAP